jgi:DDE_Tnp_1-associated
MIRGVIMDAIFEGEMPRARLAVLLKHFSQIDDDREPWRVVYPLAEVLLLLTCATIASCDDFDDIVAWGEHHLDFLRRFSAFHFGIPCVRWLRTLVNRIDPVLFGGCFESWIAALWPDRHDLGGHMGLLSHGVAREKPELCRWFTVLNKDRRVAVLSLSVRSR